MNHNIYLDHSASTPTDPQVLKAMQPYYTEIYGNPSASHHYGKQAEQAIENAREKVAQILNCKLNEIIFTSGGSESINLALRGSAWAKRQSGQGNHLITTGVEHDATTNTIKQLSQIMGFDHNILNVDHYGRVNPNTLRDELRNDTILVSSIYASNEVGSIEAISTLGQICQERNITFHTDAVQAAGQLPLDVQALNVDLMSLSAHKFYGPKGIGVLYVREGTHLLPIQTGGNHENGLRAGTQNTPLIVGLATALQIAYDELEKHTQHYRKLRDQLIDGILHKVPDAQLSGHPENRLPSHASFVFDNIESNLLLMHLDLNGIAASSGSACKTGNPEPSSVLLAMGFTEAQARGGLRFTVGRQNTEAEIDYTIETLKRIVEKLRKLSPMRSQI